MSNKQKIYALVVEDEQVLRNCNVNLITKFCLLFNSMTG